MMKLEDQVVSLDLAKKLKELGVKQESLFCWISDYDLEFLPTNIRNPDACIAAFTVAELGEMLPCMISMHDLEIIALHGINRDLFKKYWRIRYINLYTTVKKLNNYEACSFSLANALTEMLIYLIENKLMEVVK